MCVCNCILCKSRVLSWLLQLNTQLEELMIELQEYAVEPHPLEKLPLPGTPCLAQFSLDDVWYRAVAIGEEWLPWQCVALLIGMVTRYK